MNHLLRLIFAWEIQLLKKTHNSDLHLLHVFVIKNLNLNKVLITAHLNQDKMNKGNKASLGGTQRFGIPLMNNKEFQINLES